jgi:hypothetical protein
VLLRHLRLRGHVLSQELPHRFRPGDTAGAGDCRQALDGTWGKAQVRLPTVRHLTIVFPPGVARTPPSRRRAEVKIPPELSRTRWYGNVPHCSDAVRTMRFMATAGIVCGKKGFGCTIVDGNVVDDHEVEVPANLAARGEQLCWLADEVQRLVTGSGCTSVAVQKAAGGGTFGASAERIEVEAALQMGMHRAELDAKRMTRESVRAALGVPKAPKAYETLLKRDDVKRRSNAARRDQFLLALAAAV